MANLKFLVLLAGMLVCTGAEAFQAKLLETSRMDFGAVVAVPYGWKDFCGRRPHECLVQPSQAVDIKWDRKTSDTLNQVNRAVNAAITPMSNYDHWGTILDHWDYAVDGKGDCKIYALEKRRRLMALGFPRQALLMTIVHDLNGQGHTILTVATSEGDFILDNMTNTIKPWDKTGYDFVKAQSQTDPNVWFSILKAKPNLVKGRVEARNEG